MSGCEWCPAFSRPAREGDNHTAAAPATVCAGASGQWHLCESCAALPRFKAYKKRPLRRGERKAAP